MANDDNMALVDPYDFRIEARPDLVLYHPVFDQLNKSISSAVDILRQPLSKSLFQNGMTENLKKEIEYRTKECVSDGVMFAVVGDMASGKSSLINSILGNGMIARKGDPGTSCTWVVQRFMKTFPDQNSPFAAKVYFYSPAEIRAILKSHISRYFRARGKVTANENEDDDEDDNERDDEDYNEKHTVLESLMPMFCDREEFETEETAMNFLNKAESEDDEDMLEQLVSWANIVLDAHLVGNDCVLITASTSDELITNLQPYAFTMENESANGQIQPWPLVSMIDFGLDIPILNDGMILVDSPGISDANSTRAANAKNQHKECNHRIHVAKVGRARDDKSLRDALAAVYRRRGSQNSILVLTHGDEIDLDTEVVGLPLAKKNETRLKTAVKDLLARRTKLGVSRKNASEDERFAIEDELESIAADLRHQKKELEQCRLKMRNEHTKTTIQQRYKQLTGDPRPLPIYVVANDAYNIYETGYMKSDEPSLTVEETGIPAIRHQLYSLPAQSKLNDSLHLANHQLPSLINSFELYCNKTHMIRKTEIEAIVMQPKKELQEIQSRTLERLKAEVLRVVLLRMKDDEDQWIRKARKHCKAWADKYYSKHLQILKKDGFQQGRGKSSADVCWNQELLMIDKDSLESNLNELLEAINPCYDQMWEEISASISSATRKLKADNKINVMAMKTLVSAINAERATAQTRFTKSRKDLRNWTSDILEDALQDPRHGYLAKAMEPIYADVRQTTHTRGAVKKRINNFERQVCKKSGPWMRVHDTIEEAFDKLFQKHLNQLSGSLNGVFDIIHHKFILLCDDTIPKTQKEKEQEEQLIATLNKAVIKAQEMVDGPVQKLALECKNFSSARDEKPTFVSKE